MNFRPVKFAPFRYSWQDVLRNNKQLSKSEFADLANLSNRTAERYIKQFVDSKLLKVVGGGKYTKYEIV
jgi:predicted transcriptional regulator